MAQIGRYPTETAAFRRARAVPARLANFDCSASRLLARHEAKFVVFLCSLRLSGICAEKIAEKIRRRGDRVHGSVAKPVQERGGAPFLGCPHVARAGRLIGHCLLSARKQT